MLFAREEHLIQSNVYEMVSKKDKLNLGEVDFSLKMQGLYLYTLIITNNNSINSRRPSRYMFYNLES